MCWNSLGEIYCALGQLQKSKDYLLQAIRRAVEINGMDLVARVSVNLARVLQLLGDQPAAIALLLPALAHSATEQDAREKAIGWLKEMNAPFEIENDDSLLEEAASKI